MEVPANIRALFRPARDPGDVPPGTSSVLLPLVLSRTGLAILLTRRTKTMSAFAGHLSFPGGRIDPTDETPLAAALRETQEEIGLTIKEIAVLGHFTELHTHFGTLLICYAGAIHARNMPTQATSPREVEEILHVPIDSLRRPGALQTTTNRNRYVAASYEGRRIGSPHAPSRTLHYWTLTNGASTERTILWGLTAELIVRFLHNAYHWVPPVAPRLVGHVEELQP